jgi:hypothetical protein
VANEQAVQAYLDAAAGNNEARTALAAALAGDVALHSPLGGGTGPDAVLEGLGSLGPILATGTWGDPIVNGDVVRVSATFPPGAVIGGAALTFSFNADGKVAELSQQLAPAAPQPPTAVALADEIATAIDGALENGTPVIVAYVDADGQAQLSLRGTTQVYSEDQIALWIRDPEGGLLRALPQNPRLTCWYRDPARLVMYQIQGIARVETDPRARDVVFGNSPEREQVFDPERRGAAVVIDVHRVTGRGLGGLINMRREA